MASTSTASYGFSGHFLTLPSGAQLQMTRTTLPTLDSRIQDMKILTHSRQPAYGGYYPVKMPTPARYIDAMFLLYLRDLAGQRTLGHWKIELNYLISYVLEDGVNLQVDLAEPFREWARRQIDLVYDQKRDSDRAFKFHDQLDSTNP